MDLILVILFCFTQFHTIRAEDVPNLEVTPSTVPTVTLGEPLNFTIKMPSDEAFSNTLICTLLVNSMEWFKYHPLTGRVIVKEDAFKGRVSALATDNRSFFVLQVKTSQDMHEKSMKIECTVDNWNVKQILSGNVALTAPPKPPKLTIDPVYPIIEKGTITATCSSEFAGLPPLEPKLYLPNAEEDLSFLPMNQVRFDDKGGSRIQRRYNVDWKTNNAKVTCSIGQYNTEQHISVKYPPRDMKIMWAGKDNGNDNVIYPGTSVSCQVDSNPPPRITWTATVSQPDDANYVTLIVDTTGSDYLLIRKNISEVLDKYLNDRAKPNNADERKFEFTAICTAMNDVSPSGQTVVEKQVFIVKDNGTVAKSARVSIIVICALCALLLIVGIGAMYWWWSKHRNNSQGTPASKNGGPDYSYAAIDKKSPVPTLAVHSPVPTSTTVLPHTEYVALGPPSSTPSTQAPRKPRSNNNQREPVYAQITGIMEPISQSAPPKPLPRSWSPHNNEMYDELGRPIPTEV